MASYSKDSKVFVRGAQECDLDAILALLLTSFRQFPLFDFLYSPLDRNFNVARDTVFFWRRRLLLDLLDPEASVIVAEAPLDAIVNSASARGVEDSDPIYKKSLVALDWIEANGLSTVSVPATQNVIVGFAIWRFRKGEKKDSLDLGAKTAASWCSKIRALTISFEVSLWNKFYKRKDQEHTRFAAYLAAEEELSKSFYQESCYYLDNLCVDFRYQRLGIGTLLVEWGLRVAKEKGLWVGTEASQKGLGLYLKEGFKQVGWFTVAVQNVEHRIPVLRLEAPRE